MFWVVALVTLVEQVLRIIIIGVLLFRLTPVGSETVEALISITVDAGHGSGDSPDPEHGCTALVHHCSCHSVLAGTVRDVALVMTDLDTERESVFVLSRPLLEPDARELLRPPTV